jgi:hypothetical protein
VGVYRVREGVTLEAVGQMWASFSPASGETQLLNNEAAAVIEVLLELPRTLAQIDAVMSEESAVALGSITSLLEDTTFELEAAGLIEHLDAEAPALAAGTSRYP